MCILAGLTDVKQIIAGGGGRCVVCPLLCAKMAALDCIIWLYCMCGFLLFLVSRYYIRADSFPALCFPFSLSVVHFSSIGRESGIIPSLSTSACCLSVCIKTLCFLFVIICPDVSLQPQVVAK